MKTAVLARPAKTRKSELRPLREMLSKPPADAGTFDVNAFCEIYSVKRDQISRMTGFSPRTVAGWAGGQPLTTASRQKVRELKRLFETMGKVIKPQFIGAWLVEANPAFNGQLPIHLIERGEVDLLWRMIYDLGSGEPG